MKKYLSIYRLFWSQEIQKQLIYKPIMAIFSYLAHSTWIFFTYVFLLVVSGTLHSTLQRELLLFLSFFHSVKGLFWVYSSQSSGFLAGSAFRQGTIDFFLIRPANNQWAVSSFRPNIFAITDLVVGILSFLYFSQLLGLITPSFLLFYLVSVIFGAISLYGVWFSYLTLFVPSGEASAVHGLANSFWIFGQFPNRLYHGITKVITTIIFPTVIITTLPMDILLLQKSPVYLVILILFALTTLILSTRLWTRMLRFYTSAN